MVTQLGRFQFDMFEKNDQYSNFNAQFSAWLSIITNNRFLKCIYSMLLSILMWDKSSTISIILKAGTTIVSFFAKRVCLERDKTISNP